MQLRRIASLSLLGLALLCGAACTREFGTKPQTAPAESRATPVKTDLDASRILKLRGLLKDHEGKRLTGVVGVLFAIYEQKEGGAPLWQEVQNVEGDKYGRFAALVGSTKSEGIPPEFFATEKTRWLGMQVLLPGEVEQPRIRLVSTPGGLMAERATRLVIPPNVGDQTPTADAAAEPSDQAQPSQQDQSGPANRPPWRRRGRHRQLTP